ncbi:MAG: aldo/keto reductase [Anaeromyxobacteraceae bacterium]
MITRPLGTCGLAVPPVGLGTGRIGGDDVSDAEAEALVRRALELGAVLVDAARSYGRAEERLGRALAGGARDRAVVTTKVGYGIPGHADWTGGCVAAGVDAALARLGTDRIDVVFLHSCPLEVLRRDDVLGALEGAVRAGKVRAAGYSGEGEALAWAVASGRFQVIQCSVSACDQASLDGPVAEAARRGMGVLAKRSLANAPWRFRERPSGDEAEPYWERLRAMALDPGPHAWDALFLRFAAFAPGVSAALVGTRSAAHLEAAVRAAELGPLPDEDARRVRAAFRQAGAGWAGRI